jgi:hypothetical protein
LSYSNPESGTFWASVGGQKALFAVNLGSQNMKIVNRGTVGAVGIVVIWGKSGSEKVEKLGFWGKKSKKFSPFSV